MDDTVTVPLTQGKEAIIDARFAAEVQALKWHAHKRGNAFYVRHSIEKRLGRNRVKSEALFLHRFIYRLAGISIPQDKMIDHINGDGLDNRLENLRLVTHSENQQNRIVHRQGKLTGVGYDSFNKQWRAYKRIGKKVVSIGTFATEQKAHQAYLRALKRFGIDDQDEPAQA